jgi:Zn-dependent protease
MEYNFKGKSDFKSRKKCVIITNAMPIAVCLVIGMLMEALVYTDFYVFATTFYKCFIDCFISIALFNIIPVYPMSGSKVLKALLPPNAAMWYSGHEKIIQAVVVFLLLAGWLRIPLGVIKSALLSLFSIAARII